MPLDRAFWIVILHSFSFEDIEKLAADAEAIEASVSWNVNHTSQREN